MLDWLRRYAIGLALVTALVVAFAQYWTVGVGPVPQQPPEGYVIEKGTADLQWNRGTRAGDIHVQVSVDDPAFGAPAVDKVVAGTTHSVNILEPDHTYYWRLVQNGRPSRVAHFKTSKYHANF